MKFWKWFLDILTFSPVISPNTPRVSRGQELKWEIPGK